MLVVLCIWHSIIASIIFFNSSSKLENELLPNNNFVIIDRFVFVGLFTIYIFIQIALFIWLIFVPYKRRREMKYLDREYVAKKYIQLNSGQSHYESKQDLVFRRSSSVFDTAPTMKSIRTMRQSDGVIIIPNGSSFVPVQETTKKTINMVELRKQDDKQF
jgi:hypothetical protein